MRPTMDGTPVTNRMLLESTLLAERRTAPRTRVSPWTVRGSAGFTLFALSALLAVNLSLRFLWLDRLPGVNGDEAWYGVQALRWVHGLDWSARTPTGLVASPLLLLTEATLLAAFEPSFWVLRLPVAIWSLLAMWITYRLHRWVYHDPLEAGSVALLTACLPAHLAYSRFCWDGSFAFVSFPLVLYPLLRLLDGDRSLRAIGLFALGVVLTPWVHATHAVVLAAAALAWGWKHRGAIGRWIRRRPLTSSGAAALCVFAAVRLVDESHTAAILWESVATSLPRLGRHLSGLAGVLGGSRVFEYLSGWPGVGLDLVVVPLFYVCAIWGLWVLGRSQRSSDRHLAIYAVCIVCLVLLAGRALRLHRSSYERYILYMVPLAGVAAARALRLICDRGGRHTECAYYGEGRHTECAYYGGGRHSECAYDGDHPTAVFAPLGRSLHSRKSTPSPLWGEGRVRGTDTAVTQHPPHRIHHGDRHGSDPGNRFVFVSLAVSLLLLAYAWHGYFAPLGDGTYADRQHRTFWSGAEEPKAAVAAAIRHLGERAGGGRVIVEDWWLEHALSYLLGVDYAVQSGVAVEQAAEGGVVVGFGSSAFTAAVRGRLEDTGRSYSETGFAGGERGCGLVLMVIAPARERDGEAQRPLGFSRRGVGREIDDRGRLP